jgi:diaminopimelate epimerase
VTYPFLKGHGTQNDFVLLPDHDGTLHGDLAASRVAALCDRRAGIGADGVIRVVRTSAIRPAPAAGGGAEWFMDYRNADGSVSEMCGNGIRLFARHLVDEGLVDGSGPLRVATRDGVKTLTVDGERVSVDLGPPEVLDETEVGIGSRWWPARDVRTGNPHAVAFVDDLTDAGRLLDPPEVDASRYPDGANVEFVVRTGPRRIAMRVHERGVGETRSCGTGACAAMVATAVADGAGPGVSYDVDVPGGRLTVTWTPAGSLELAGPAVVVARGTTDL